MRHQHNTTEQPEQLGKAAAEATGHGQGDAEWFYSAGERVCPRDATDADEQGCWWVVDGNPDSAGGGFDCFCLVPRSLWTTATVTMCEVYDGDQRCPQRGVATLVHFNPRQVGQGRLRVCGRHLDEHVAGHFLEPRTKEAGHA